MNVIPYMCLPAKDALTAALATVGALDFINPVRIPIVVIPIQRSGGDLKGVVRENSTKCVNKSGNFFSIFTGVALGESQLRPVDLRQLQGIELQSDQV